MPETCIAFLEKKLIMQLIYLSFPLLSDLQSNTQKSTTTMINAMLPNKKVCGYKAKISYIAFPPKMLKQGLAVIVIPSQS